MIRTPLRLSGIVAVLCLCAQMAAAQEAVIRKNIAERLPDFPKIDEINKTPSRASTSCASAPTSCTATSRATT